MTFSGSGPRGQLGFHGQLKFLAQPKAFSSLLRQLFRHDWVVYSKRAFGVSQDNFPRYCKGLYFCLDIEGNYLANTRYCLGTADRYLLGILNSRLFWFAISNISIPFGVRAGEYRYRLIYQYMEKVPIRTVDFSDPSDRAQHDRMVRLVERMLELNERKHSGKLAPSELQRLEREIATTETEIDDLVFRLYGITDEERKIIQGVADE